MQKKNKIIVIPSAGLGNRMRVISSSIQLAKNHDRNLWIVWPKNSALGCELSDIFENIGFDYQIPNKCLNYILIQLFRHGAIKKYSKLYKWIFKFFFISNIFDDDMNYENQPNMEINNDNEIIIIATCYAFGNKLDYKLFEFTNYLKKQVELEYQKIGESYIGIHIRRTDHYDVINHSPLENYIIQIDKCISKNYSQKLFLATDDKITKEYLINKYGKRMHTYNHELGRNSIDGIRGAVIELLLLSKSDMLICSNLSSFSDTAILIGDIKHIINVDKT